jgi:beta-galactosidase
MITISHGHFMEDGKPVLILAGEIHYFRLDPSLWERHLDMLLDSGCDTVSTYVPWLVHEETEGDFNFTGIHNPSYDLVGFLELAARKGLKVFLRPGPYVMAELKNEGLPFWIFSTYPELRTTTWKGEEGPHAIVDLLHPVFLRLATRYLEAFIRATRPFYQSEGGPVFAIQIDNEIGMLDWVNNKPALTDDVTNALGEAFDNNTRMPAEGKSLLFHDRLGRLMRARFRDYALKLKDVFDRQGIKDMLYMANIHGTSGGRSKSFPIGISQLLDVINDDAFIGGTDVYYDDITLGTFQDVIIANAFFKASIGPEKPMTALEFGVGDGNYGDDLFGHQMESSNAFRLRMHIAQGHRMVNNYLFSGGINPHLRVLAHDGNDRIAITGERHGFAAPVSHTGEARYTYNALKETQTTLKTMSSILLRMDEHADVVFGFVPDDYMTEYRVPGDKAVKNLVDQLQMHRSSVVWDRLAKGLMLNGMTLTSMRLDTPEGWNGIKGRLLVIPVCQYMDKTLQQRIKDHIDAGNRTILVGELPRHDRLGSPVTILSDALSATPLEPSYGWTAPNLSARSVRPIEGHHEFRTFLSAPVKTSHEPLITTLTGETLAFRAGEVIVIGTDYPGDPGMTSWMTDMLGATSMVKASSEDGYVFHMVQTKGKSVVIHLFNLEQRPVKVGLSVRGTSYLEDRPVVLAARDARMLLFDVRLNDTFEVVRSTAEIIGFSDSDITFRQSGADDTVILRTSKDPLPGPGFTWSRKEDRLIIRILRRLENETSSISFEAGR